jgi:hypothetical protein
MLRPEERQAKILAEFDALESTHHIIIERDRELLAEVVAITENILLLSAGDCVKPSPDDAFLGMGAVRSRTAPRTAVNDGCP